MRKTRKLEKRTTVYKKEKKIVKMMSDVYACGYRTNFRKLKIIRREF